jgi:hypothetical protein
MLWALIDEVPAEVTEAHDVREVRAGAYGRGTGANRLIHDGISA